MTYITQECDFYDAITKSQNLDGFAIDTVTHITENKSMVRTTHGNYICESFKDGDANTYMKVYKFI
jgi:hypothetical protein